MIKFDQEINLGQIIQMFAFGIPAVWWASKITTKVDHIEEEIVNMKDNKDREHDEMRDAQEQGDSAIRREINNIRRDK